MLQGSQIANRYTIENTLGKGGMGTVYRGLDTDTQQTVAIKQLNADLARPEIIERFRREGEALRELNHPNIVKMLDTFKHDDQHFLVMEYVSGGDLAGLINQGEIPYEQIMKLSIDLADALTRAHKLNIIHRDLKPANVLIGDDGVLRLTDFGVAHVGSKERVTATDAIVGTIDYLPPEAFDGQLFDERGDIWAFGVMLFEMLAGQRPFVGETIVEVIQSIVTQPIPDLEALRPDIPIDLIDLVYRMIERDPSARISSVRHVGAILEDIIAGRTATRSELGRFDTPISELQLRPKHNIPAQTTTFVGRESELAELTSLLENPNLRLMTILAPGGMGKTRLAIEIASRFIADPSKTNSGVLFPDGVYVAELAPLTHPDQIIPTIAHAIEYTFPQDNREPKQTIT